MPRQVRTIMPFYPVINKSFTWDNYGSEVMNYMGYSGGTVNFSQRGSDNYDANTIVPFPYLSYVLKRIEIYTGWRFEGDILNDPNFKKITLENSTAIDWAKYMQGRLIVLGSGIAPTPRATVEFNLQDHVPDVTISAFLLALRNRLGWYYDVDPKNKVVRVQQLNTVATTSIKSFTSKASPLVSKSISQQQKIYSLKTTADSDAVNLSGVNYVGEINLYTDLPAAVEALYTNVYLVRSENNYYICMQNDSDENFHWEIFDYNIRAVVPAGATDEITTAALTVGSETYSAYLDLIPRYDKLGYWLGRTQDSGSDEIILLFYYGVRNNKAGQPYPFASHHIYDSTGTLVGDWSLAFLAKKLDGSDCGLYPLNWKKLLDTIAVSETFQNTLYLSKSEYLDLKFSDKVNIANVNIYLTKIKERIPFGDGVNTEAVRA
jgi:hypothetical protein